MTRTALVRTDRYSWGAIWLHWSIAVLVLVNLVLALVVLQIAAALRHHFSLRDAVLGRMAPR